MTVASSVARWQYTANGATTSFAAGRILSAADLVVVVVTAGVEVTQVLNTDYTVSGVGSNAGSTVVFGVAPLNAAIVSIRRVLPLTQLTSIRNQGAFFPEIHEDTFDRLVMMIQQVNDMASRAFQPDSVLGDSFDIGGKKISNLAAGSEDDEAVNVLQLVTYIAAALAAAQFAAGQITSGTLGVDRIPGLPASKTTSGEFNAARIPSLDASKVNAGTFADARIPNLSASKITSNTFADQRIAVSNVKQHEGSLALKPSQVVQFAGTQNVSGAINDLVLDDLNDRDIIFLNPGAGAAVSSISNTASSGHQRFWIFNVGTNALSFLDQTHGFGAAANRILVPDSNTITIAPRRAAMVVRDTGLGRWRMVGPI